ncbi:hypothetical protein KWV16_16985 [Clostridioides difficile]|nr:hypothetical protein [Clostridioides difficile]
MDFKTNIFELQHRKNFTINFLELKLPANKDLFFRAKQDEIFQQYESARIFMHEAQTDDWSHWFEKPENSKEQKIYELLFTERMYECALMYYNSVVDLSWVMCYVSVEYMLHKDDKVFMMDGMVDIETACNILRKAEDSVKNPTDKEAPFLYLKNRCPEFEEAIDLVINFWKVFKETHVRKLYNYIKHKGKPIYSELNEFRQPKIIKLKGQGEYPTDIRDICMQVSLNKCIDELYHFDDEILFPYIKKLFELLEGAIKPSPII